MRPPFHFLSGWISLYGVQTTESRAYIPDGGDKKLPYNAWHSKYYLKDLLQGE